MKWFSALFILEFVYIISAQYLESPCPSYFEYVSDGNYLSGLIHLWPEGPLRTLLLRANFTVSGQLAPNDAGALEPVGYDVLQNYNKGKRISFRVRFPAGAQTVPKLTALSVNDRIICIGQGDIPTRVNYVSTISLKNYLHLKIEYISGDPGQVFFTEQPTQTPDPFHFYKPKGNKSQNANNIEDVVVVVDLGQNPNGLTYQNENQLIQSILNQNLNPTTNQPPYPNRPNHRPPHKRPWHPRPTNHRPTYDNVSVVEDNNPYKKPENNPQQKPGPQDDQKYPSQNTKPTQTTPTVVIERVPETVTRPNEVTSEIQCGVSAGNTRVPLIYNGESFAKGDWPWLVAVYKRKDGGLSFICSGTLVSDRHVITAAHCMHTKSLFLSIKDIVVKVGVYNLEDWGDDGVITRTLASAAIHESYNSSTLANDILVVTFDRRVQFSVNIRPACLWTDSSDLNRVVGSVGVVTGWGQSELGGAGHGEPRMVRMPIVSTATCRASKPDFHKLTSAYTLCAGDRNGAGPCLGDSGAGLYLMEGGQWRLRGVVSLSLRAESGDHSCNLNEYIVFTDAAQYLAWIQYIMNT